MNFGYACINYVVVQVGGLDVPADTGLDVQAGTDMETAEMIQTACVTLVLLFVDAMSLELF